MHHKGLMFCKTLEFDISSNYCGKASVQCCIGVSNPTHLAKLAYSDWFINEFEKCSLKPRAGKWNKQTPYLLASKI